MSFTQIKRAKIAKCDGCKKHCAIDTEQSTDKKYIPTIDGAAITSYIDKTGKTLYVHPNNNRYLVIKLGLAICELCDKHR